MFFVRAIQRAKRFPMMLLAEGLPVEDLVLPFELFNVRKCYINSVTVGQTKQRFVDTTWPLGNWTFSLFS